MADSPHIIKSRRPVVAGADAQIIMGNDEAALLRLWRTKRGELKPDDASDDLAAQLGAATKALNRRWCEKSTGYAVSSKRRLMHPVHRWMAANIDGRIEAIEAVFDAEFVSARTLSEEEAAATFMAQLQHDMWVTASRCAVLSIITGRGDWMGIMVHADPLSQHLLLTAERKFCRCVQSGEPPRLFGIDFPQPRIERVGAIDTPHSRGAKAIPYPPAEPSEPLIPPAFSKVDDEVVYIANPSESAISITCDLSAVSRA